MKMKMQTIPDKYMYPGVWCLSFVVYLIIGLLLRTTVCIDEIGTLANAALVCGDNWEAAVASVGNFYYKYGSVVLFAPVYWLFHDGALCYKGIIIIQGAMLSFIPVISYRILRRFFQVRSQIQAAMVSVFLGIMPTVVLHSLYARIESFIIFLPWLVVLLMLESNKALSEKKTTKTIVLSVLIAISSMYAYACHTRGIVVVVATILTLVVGQFICKIKIVNWPAYVITMIPLYFIDKQLTHYFKNAIWRFGRETSKVATSVEDYNFRKFLQPIESAHNFGNFVKMILGWAYETITSTYGLVLFGFGVSVVIVFCAFMKKKRDTFSVSERIVAAFSFLVFMGSYAIGILFFFNSTKKILDGLVTTRNDKLIFGRYLCGAVGMLVFLALYYLLFKSDKIKLKHKVLCLVVQLGIIEIFFKYLCPYLDANQSNLRSYIDAATFIIIPNGGGTVGHFDNIGSGLAMMTALSMTVIVLIFMLHDQSEKWRYLLCAGLLALVLLVNANSFFKQRLWKDGVIMYRTEAAKELLDDFGDLYKEYPTISSETRTVAQYYTIGARDYNYVRDHYLDEQTTDYLIIVRKNIGYEKYQDIYKINEYDYVEGFDSIYVHGENLKKELEKRGFTLSKVAN